MNEFLQALDYHHWLVFGLALLTAEVFIGGAFFLWLGLSSITLGVLVLLFPGLSWQIQLVLFAIGAVISLFAWYRYIKSAPPEEDSTLNQRGAAYIGQEYLLSEPIEHGVGKLVIDDTIWMVKGPDTPEGEYIKVIAREGSHLVVEKT